MAHPQQDGSAFLPRPPAAGGWMRLPPVSDLKRVEVYIRECYVLLYADIQDYFDLGKRFVHISGNPGTGKSCFLWYVLANILNDPAERGNAVILQLVEDMYVRTFEILAGDEKLKTIDGPRASPYYSHPRTWLLIDQRFAGCAAERTVLFASPKEDNWGKAVRLLDERVFTTLYMPPWSVPELKAVYFRDKAPVELNIIKFWVRFYLSGPIVRWYSLPVKTVYSQLVVRVTKVVETEKSINATLLRGAGVDKGDFSHHVFCSWPSLDFTEVKAYSFVSAFAADCFARACFRGDLQNWRTELLKLAADPDLRSAAGTLFERYAHFALSQGGVFPSADDPELRLVIRPRQVSFFSGSTFPLESASLAAYLRPRSSNFPWFDAACLPDVLLQMSLAKTRKPIPKSVYDSLVVNVKELWNLHPDATSGVQGGTAGEVYAVLVKLQGDDHTSVPEGLRVWEEVPDEEEGGTDETEEASSPRPKRRRARMSRRPPATDDARSEPRTRKPKRKLTRIRSQMTIALEQQGMEMKYESLTAVYRRVEGNMVYTRDATGSIVDGADAFAKEYGNFDSEGVREEEDQDPIQVLMRRGEGAAYWEEMDDDDELSFAVSVHARRSDDTTLVHIAGPMDKGRSELRIFIDERRGHEIRYISPFVIPINLSTASDEEEYKVTVEASDGRTGDKYVVTVDVTKVASDDISSDEYNVTVRATEVKIVSNEDRRRTGKHFCIRFEYGSPA